MGAPGTQAVDLSFSELARPYEDEPALDFVVRAGNRRLRVETSVRTWDGDDRAPGEEWHFETTTVHAAGEDMRNLAADVRAFLSGAAGGVTSAGR